MKRPLLLLLFLFAGICARAQSEGTVHVKKLEDADTGKVAVTFGGLSGQGVLSKEKLAAIDSLETWPKGNWQVDSFYVSVAAAGMFKDFRQTSAVISPEAKAALAALKTGDRVFVEMISVSHRRSRKAVKLASITVRVE